MFIRWLCHQFLNAGHIFRLSHKFEKVSRLPFASGRGLLRATPRNGCVVWLVDLSRSRTKKKQLVPSTSNVAMFLWLSYLGTPSTCLRATPRARHVQQVKISSRQDRTMRLLLGTSALPFLGQCCRSLSSNSSVSISWASAHAAPTDASLAAALHSFLEIRSSLNDRSMTAASSPRIDIFVSAHQQE